MIREIERQIHKLRQAVRGVVDRVQDRYWGGE